MVKNLPANAGDTRDTGLIPVLGRSPGEGNGILLQYSCLENPMDRGAWQATIHRVTKSWTRLKGQRDSVQVLSQGGLFAMPWTAVCQTSPSITSSWSLLKLMIVESVMPFNHFILCHLLLLLPSIFPSINVFVNELASVLLMNIRD